jgi:hypothetical protein
MPLASLLEFSKASELLLDKTGVDPFLATTSKK